MPEPLYVLPVDQPSASELVRKGNGFQLSRNFPCEEECVGRWVAIQATDHTPEHADRLRGPEWSIVGVGKLTGVGYYPGFSSDRECGLGKAYKRRKGMAGAWIWTFTSMVQVDPIRLAQLPAARGDVDVGGRTWSWVDEGDGGWWSCCPRPLEEAMVQRVRDARRKARR